MLDQRRICISDIIIGEPLRWDVYGEGRQLLLRKGHIVENLHQAEELIERGLFIDSSQADKSQTKSEGHTQKQEIPSALRFINLANKRLERLLYNLHNEADAQNKIIEVAKAITFAIDINQNVALGCIFLNQTASQYAVRHGIDTAIVAMLVARAMKKSPEEITNMMSAALTMNISLLRQQDYLRDKQEPLSEKEKDMIKNHPQESVNLLQQCGINNPDWLSYVLFHHENDNGSGYPHGKKEEDIPQNARILALADRYCACVTQRKYRKILLPNAALRELFLAEGKVQDPLLAAYFIKELGTYPPGTFVRLQSGEIGVVSRPGKSAATPMVHALIGPRGAPLSFPIQRDTLKELYTVREPLSSEQAALRFSMQQLWGNDAAL